MLYLDEAFNNTVMSIKWSQVKRRESIIFDNIE